jgi:hypothetical protein
MNNIVRLMPTVTVWLEGFDSLFIVLLLCSRNSLQF